MSYSRVKETSYLNNLVSITAIPDHYVALPALIAASYATDGVIKAGTCVVNATTRRTALTPVTVGTKGEFTVTIGGTWATGDTFAVNSTTTTLTSTTAASNEAVAAAIVTAHASDTTYTVTSSENVVTFVQKTAAALTTVPTVTTSSTNGTAIAALTAEGVASNTSTGFDGVVFNDAEVLEGEEFVNVTVLVHGFVRQAALQKVSGSYPTSGTAAILVM